MSRPEPPSSKWDRRYAAPDFVYGTDPNDFLRETADRIPPGGRVLCLAEGEGRNAVHLGEMGFRVVAVDQSAVGLEKARRLARERGVLLETVRMDLGELRIEPGGWDGIVSIWCHVPSSLRRDLHRRVVEGLRPGGVLILEAYTPRQLDMGTGGPPDADRLMTADALRRELSGLTPVILREVEREVREGRLHSGPSHVVQLVARREEEEAASG